MSHPSFKRWRELGNKTMPSRFESTVNRFRRLAEVTTPTRDRKYQQPDRRIEVDTVTTPNALNMASSMEDPAELEKERQEERERQLDFTRSRLLTLKWIKKQARKDFNMVGGTSPTGAMGGSGGSDGARPVSFSSRQ